MNLFYNQNYTVEEIEKVLAKIKQCIDTGKYQISQNDKRSENIAFINAYNLRTDKQKSILMQLQPSDFCHSLENTKLGYEHETLYVFVPQVELYNLDDEKETVDIYTKFNIIDLPSGSRVVVISFHKLNRPIDYLFR